MSLSAGTRLGPYDILSALGAGGMGEVYRARDTRLNRDVALKVLAEAFASDAERLARFEREAQVLASLNHSNIAHVYGVERAGATYALVMELVEGDDLSQRIARGALPLDDVFPIAGQIADALEAAHERGIVHRDLKPANIKICDDGTVKVLDFGLAKASAAAFVGDGLSPGGAQESPTITSPAMTQQGVILGTAAYMAPEQAKGKIVDRRADIWAFGCVLYEMLTGNRAFRGEDVTETLAAILRAQPEWSALPAGTPASVRRLLRRCLEKEAKHRLSSMGDARLELEECEEAPATLTARPSERRVRPWPLAAAVLVGATVTALAFVTGGARLRAPQRPAVRLALAAPLGTSFSGDSADVALSPDGRMLAFTTETAAGATRIWVRPLDSLDARPLAGTEGGRLPFWSPDSTELAYFSEGKLKKVSVAGGVPQVICDAKDGRGGTWSREGGILLAPSNNGPLFRVSPDGGELSGVTTLDRAAGEIGHRFPSFLADGRTFLFAAMPPKGGPGRHQIFAGSLDSTERTFLLEATGVPVYAEPRYLLFARDNVILAQRFDARARTLAGEAQALGDILDRSGGRFVAAPAVSVSSSGAFAYVGGKLADTKVAVFDRSGREHSVIDVPPGHYAGVSIAPDGRRLALVRRLTTLETDVWLADVARPGASRFTFGGALNTGPVWSADGGRIAFAQAGTGARNLVVRPSNGAAPEEPLFASPAPFKDVFDWSPDGRFVVMGQLDQKTGWDLWILPVAGDRTPKPYLQTPFNESNARISPDGRWLAYVSNESGRHEVYVQSFPTAGNRYQVTTRGSGPWVRWRGDGRELAMIDGDRRELLTAEIKGGANLQTGTPRRLMSLPRNHLGMDITRDFQRVLVIVPAEGSAPSILVVTDWLAGIKK